MPGSRCRRPGAESTRRRGGPLVALFVAATGLLALEACGAGRVGGSGEARVTRPEQSAARTLPAASALPAARAQPAAPASAESARTRWFAFTAGRAHPIAGPAAATASFEPWTVQTRVAGLLSMGSRLYIALNGWGLLELPRPAAALEAGGAPFRRYENRRLFAERTINGFAADSGKIIVHLYRNTVFATKPPSPTPVSYAQFDRSSGKLTPVALRPSLEGWEAVGVVTTAKGSWAIAWKKTLPQKVEFRYSIFDPADGESRTIDRAAFVSAYDFIPIAGAPSPVRQLTAVAAALEAPPGSAGTGSAQVVHLLLRGDPFARTSRYSEGPETELAAGNAALATVPAVQSGDRVYALISGGRLLRSGRGGANESAQKALLPLLPTGYAYTDFWTDGRTVVASWEQQRFAQVGAAGICIVAVAGLQWQGA